MILFLAGWMAGCINGPWIIAGLMLRVARVHRFQPDPFSQWIHRTLKPFYLPAVAVGAGVSFWMDAGRGPGEWSLDVFVLALSLAAWYRYRNEGQDDDRWKRRRRKVAEAVKRAGARLAAEAVAA